MVDLFNSTESGSEELEGSMETDAYEKVDAARSTFQEYTPPSRLKPPQEMKDRFREHGFYLKWVNSAPKSIRKRQHPSEGYSFVSPKELTDDELLYIGDIQSFGGTDVVTSGDVVLMKTRIENAEARRAYYQGKTRDQQEAIQRRLNENALDSKGSRSIVRTGKNAHFSN
jgi:hypothetical protein